MLTFSFAKVCEPLRLKNEIEASSITIALDIVVVSAGNTSVTFKADLSTAEETILNDLITAHVNTPMPMVSNKVEVTSIPAIASKTLSDGSKIYERVMGIQQDVTAVNPGVHEADVIVWRCPTEFCWVKFLGVHFINTTALDTVDLEVFDRSATDPAGPPFYAADLKLNQFGFTANMNEGDYLHKANFDADLYAGMVIKITYKSSVTKRIGVNFILNEVKAS